MCEVNDELIPAALLHVCRECQLFGEGFRELERETGYHNGFLIDAEIDTLST